MKTLKSILPLLAATALTLAAVAQETVDIEDARKGARLLTEKLGEVSDAPFKIEADLDKPSGLRANEVRILVIPDKKLTAEAIAKAGDKPLPVAQLWMLRVSPVTDGKATPNDKLRLLTITADGQEHQVNLHYLGIQKAGKDLQLVVFAKDKEPLLKLPLEKSDGTQSWPIEISGRKEEDRGILTLNLLGKYRAELTLTRQE
ncbi:MAG: hypothetical protein AB1705_13755 [Verrucomicrobiota bacterium]